MARETARSPHEGARAFFTRAFLRFLEHRIGSMPRDGFGALPPLLVKRANFSEARVSRRKVWKIVSDDFVVDNGGIFSKIFY